MNENKQHINILIFYFYFFLFEYHLKISAFNYKIPTCLTI